MLTVRPVGGDGPVPPPAPGPVRAVGVLVPARDERDHVAACLDAALTALARLPADVQTALCLVVDRSVDGTGAVARRAVAAHGHTRTRVDVVTNAAPLVIGAVRNLAARTLLRRLAPVAPERTWLLSTDADSTVGPDWAAEHLRLADAGIDAVAGGVELDGPGRLGPDPSPSDPGDRPPRPGLYAANLGVRAAAFRRVGGFPGVVSGEEHALLARLLRGGHRLVTGADITVRTSARTHGRASGGLADLLRERAGELPESPTGVPAADDG
ncbi:glycosyltransferase family 2 protein [Pseudonocardia sp. KRD291]|uniref:glycosyltransferase n=1 Tax=Pseudonocardia sp. KRD291 TaxID=2792007 RepID=UPI001C4A2A69|nr:glycosyltransferase [Pseudonocardia sp. KRD291]MBW0105832.1 glycosyltransferase [Pseudonocardia sp. KRD291]